MLASSVSVLQFEDSENEDEDESFFKIYLPPGSRDHHVTDTTDYGQRLESDNCYSVLLLLLMSSFTERERVFVCVHPCLLACRLSLIYFA